MKIKRTSAGKKGACKDTQVALKKLDKPKAPRMSNCLLENFDAMLKFGPPMAN